MTSKIVYKGQLRSILTHLRSQTSIETDAPVDNAGKGERFSPTDLVATALGACMVTTMGIKTADKGWHIEGTEMKIEKIMAANPRRIDTIRVIITFPKGAPTDPKDRKILENIAKNCPVAKSLHPDIRQDLQIIWQD